MKCYNGFHFMTALSFCDTVERDSNVKNTIRKTAKLALPIITIIIVVFISSSAASVPRGGALAGNRYRVIISTDIGGGDEDDIQSMVHYLLYLHCLYDQFRPGFAKCSSRPLQKRM